RESCCLEKRLVHAQGHLLWARVSVRLVRSETGHPEYFVASIENIGEHKRAEQLNRAVEQKLRAIVDHVPVVVWMSTPDVTRVRFVNEAYESIWGRPKESLY